MTTEARQRPTTIAGRRETLAALDRLMRERLDEPDLTLDHIAAAAFVSRRQAQRVFAEAGDSFRTRLARLRMERAAQLLREEPDRYVRLIAREVGYRQPAQFAKAFRRLHGVSPAEYRGRVARGS